MSIISDPHDYCSVGGNDRVYYYQTLHPELYSQTIISEKSPKKRRNLEPCACIMSTLFIILIILLVAAIVLFFTLGGLLGPANGSINQGQNLAITKPKEARMHTDSVSPEWLKAILEIGTPKLCILDTLFPTTENKTEIYAEEHIDGAVYFDLSRVTNDFQTSRNSPAHPLKFENYLQSLGVNQNCHVILYDHGETKYYSLFSVTFSFWLFKLFGHNKVSMLKGGLTEWKNRNFSTSDSEVKIQKRGNFKAAWKSEEIATIDDVVANFETNRYLLIDTRPKSYFEGKQKSKFSKKTGKIKGATNLPYVELLGEDGQLLANSEIRRVLINHGISGQDPVIVYCETGVSASILYFVLKEANVDVKLYQGSWVEFSHKAQEQYMD